MLEIFKTPIRVKELRKQVAKLQNDISILISGMTETSTTQGNPYITYNSAITELAKKYEGIAKWGVQQIRNIIDVRSAFIIGQGIKLSADKNKAGRELEFIKEFIKHNNLDEEMPQELAKEAEIEGRILVKLIPSKDKKQIDMRFISYSVNGYKIETDPEDYQKYISVKYRNKTKQTDIILNGDEFVYKKFAGRIDKVNEVMPKTAMVLRHCEDLDKALWDWRQINNLFAAPTPYFKCTSKEEVEKLYSKLKEINWKVGKMLVGTADFSMVGIMGEGIDAIEKEIISLAKIMSGATGVPVHFLGLPDLMSNRAVSTDLFEFINASTNKERHIWEGFYEELFDKALLMANKELKRGFEPGTVKAQILNITEIKIKELAEVWLPLYTVGVIDLDYFLSKIPDADPEKIKQSHNESTLKMLEGIKKQEKEETEIKE